MKILYFTNVPSPYNVDFFNELSKTENLTALFDEGNNEKRDSRWYEHNVYHFSTIQIPKFGYFKLKEILKEHFDIVVIGTYANINGAILMYLLRRKHIPFFINADGGFIDPNDNFITYSLKHYFISRATFYLSSGAETSKYLTHYGAREKDIFLQPFTSLFKKDILEQPISYEIKFNRRKAAGYPYQRLFVSVGSLIDRKGYDLFLNAIKDKDTEGYGFLIVGSGEKKDELTRMIDEYKLDNVHLIDFCDKEKVFEYLQMSDIFFFPSREDIWGLVINEAMANGLPIISSNHVLASLELIHPDFLYSPGNIDDLFSLIEKTGKMTEKELYAIGLENLGKIEPYTIENMANRHIEIFKEVLKHE